MGRASMSIGDVELLFADAWAAHNRAEIAAIVRADEPGAATAAAGRAEAAIEAATAALDSLEGAQLGDEDRRARTTMRVTLELLGSGDSAHSAVIDGPAAEGDNRPADVVLAAEGLAALTRRTMAGYSAAADSIDIGEATVGRLDVLGRLATEPDPDRRRALFMALEPMWRTVDGDGGPTSPFRVAAAATAETWKGGGSPVDLNARGLGIDPADVEPWLRTILATWRDVAVTGSVEPWDLRFENGAFNREMDGELPLAELVRINHAWYDSLGADPAALGIDYDIAPRPGRGPVPVAFALDVDVPRRTADGWTAGEQWGLASYGRPRIPDLGELLHETGHAIHYRAVRTRPAFAPMTDQLNTLVEALGELVAWDLFEPSWQRRYLDRAQPVATNLRARYGEVILDVAWSLFEIETYKAPGRSPNDVWTAITSDYLGVVAHPEWSWWAVRGQLVQSPGYMVNYGLGAIITADLRAHLRAVRGDWTDGDPGWYEAVSRAIYRWGSERLPGDVLTEFLGRPVSTDALVTDLRRMAGTSTKGA